MKDPWAVLGVGSVVCAAVAVVVGRGLAVPPQAAADVAAEVGSPEDAQDATSRPTSAAVPAHPSFTTRV